MRVEGSFRSSLVLLVLGAAACGGSPTPPPAAPDPTPTAPTPAAGEPAASKPAAAADEEGWAGENAAKNGDTKPAAASDTPAVAPAPNTDPKAPETRTMEVIRKLVMDNRKAARKCYEDARKDLKDLKGDVTIHFVLDPEGNVKSAELNQERSTLKSPAVVDCVIGVIKGIKFPKSSRAMETSTNYPFNFTP
jgi:hypothetical protein